MTRKNDENQRSSTSNEIEDESDGTSQRANSLDKETYLFWAGKVMEMALAKKALAKRVRGVRKIAKESGVVLKRLDALMAMIEMDDASVEDHLSGMVREASWLGLVAAGYQGDLFSEGLGKSPLAEDDLILLKAKDAGYRSGLMGLSDNPHDGNTPAGQRWMEGWHAGQEILKDRFVNLNAEIEAELEAA